MDIMRLEIIVTVSNWLGQSTSGNGSTWIQLDQAGSFHVPRPRAPNCEPQAVSATTSEHCEQSVLLLLLAVCQAPQVVPVGAKNLQVFNREEVGRAAAMSMLKPCCLKPTFLA